MSSRPITLEDYLSGRKAANRKHAQRPLHFKDQPLAGQGMHSHLPPPQQPVYSSERQPWQTSFPDCKRQCQQELRRLRERIANEQYYIVRYLQNYENQVHTSMQEQFQRIKQELVAMLDRSFEENRKRVKENFHHQGGHQLAELDQIRHKLNHIKRQLDDYDRVLESTMGNYVGANYKNGIAAVVLADFQGEGQSLMNQVAAVLMRYEDKVFLRVDSVKFSRIRDDISTLISYGDFDRGRMEVAAANITSAALTAFKGYGGAQKQVVYEPVSRPNALFAQQSVPYVPYTQPPQQPVSTSAFGQQGFQQPPSATLSSLHRNRDLLLSHQPPPQ